MAGGVFVRFAIDRFVNDRDGKELEVAATDIYREYGEGYIPRAQYRFFCPECHEKVFFRRKGSGEFYHQAKKEFTPECDNRVDGNSDLYIYERTGLPLYITHKYGDVYSLNIAFPALGTQMLQQAFKNNVFISISNRKVIPVTPSRFYDDEITLISIDFIPHYGHNYSIDISGVGAGTIQKKWSNYADGFSSEGAFFSIHNNFGKKVKRGDSITINREYYLVAKNFQPLYTEISSKKIGRIRLNDIEYNLYIVNINTSVESKRFSAINDYIYRKFKVWLIEKAATVTPIWPPVVDQGDQIVFTKNSIVFCNVESGNLAPKVFTYSGKDVWQIPVYTDSYQNKSVKLTLRSYEPIVISVDKKYTGRELNIRKSILPSTINQADITVLSKSGEVIDISMSVDSEKLNDGFIVKSNTKFSVITETRNNVFNIISLTNEETLFEMPKQLKCIMFAYESSLLEYVIFKSIFVNETRKSIDVDEQLLIKEIQKRCYGPCVNAPLWIKDLFNWCSTHNMVALNEILTTTVKNGQMYVSLISYLNWLRRIQKND